MTAPTGDSSGHGPGHGPGHDGWAELAAGWALYALDPADEAAFRSHLHTCPRCQQEVAAHHAVAAQLVSSLSEATQPTPDMPLLLRKEVGLIGGPRGRALRARREVLRSRWITTVAAAIVALVLGGVVGLSLDHGHSAPSHGSTVAAAAVGAFAKGTLTHLTSTDGVSEATVAVLDGKGYLNVTGLPALSGQKAQYVAWIAGSDERLHAVAHFEGGSSVTVGLGSTGSAVHTFAVSREKAGPLPLTPSKLVLQST